MGEERYIPINKGHFSLDTEERIKAFSEKLSVGWEKEYKEYRTAWNELPKKREIRDYPLLVDLELASVCNLRCPMCYTITDEFKSKVKKGLMDFDLFKKIVDEIAGKVYAIRLSFRGEPMLHKQFLEFLTYAKKAGIKEVSTLTNGAKLDIEYFDKLVKAGIDWITISIDGTGETYNMVRKPLTFDGMVKKLRDIKEYKEKNGLVKPVIKIQSIWPAIRENPAEYYEIISEVCDLVAYNPLIDYLRKDDEDDIVFEDNFACPQYYQRIVVGSDGKVMMCSNDEDGEILVGDAYKQTIHELWHSDVLNKMRDIHNQPDGFKEIDVCRKCYYPRKAIPNEQAQVGDRTILIENYVNRKQEIGQ